MREIVTKDLQGYRFLSILPLSHLFEQNVGLFMLMVFGANVVYIFSRKSSAILSTICEERINAVVSVPLFLDAIKKKIESTALEKGKLEKLQYALKRFENSSRFIKRIIFRKILERFRELEFFIVGGGLLWIWKLRDFGGVRALKSYRDMD